MRRRALLLVSGAWAALGASGAFAQSGKSARRIGWLYPGPGTRSVAAFAAFSAQMKALGYVERRDIVYELRGTEGRDERLPVLARELVATHPAVIVTTTVPATRALMQATRTLPIVFAAAGSPVEEGLVKSFARPGGNVTGVSVRLELMAKAGEYVREVLPGAKRMVVLAHELYSYRPGVGFSWLAREVGPAGLEVRTVVIDKSNDIERAFAEIGVLRPDAILVGPSPPFITHARRIVELALDLRIPVFGVNRQHVAAGALLAYYTDDAENFRRAAALVDKILKGKDPAELPVDQPERFYLVINAQTAEVLDITMPQSVLLRADGVIE